MRRGRSMGYTSHEVKKIYQELRNGNFKYAPNCELCRAPGCRGGFKHNTNTNKIEPCENCDSYGFLRKN